MNWLGKRVKAEEEFKVGDDVSVNLATGEIFGVILEIKDGQALVHIGGVSFGVPKKWFDLDLLIKRASLTHKADDELERPPTTYKPYKIKPKDVDVPPAVPPASKGVEELMIRIEKAETTKVNIANDVIAAQEEIEQSAGLVEITRQEQEALEQISNILEAGEESMMAIGERIVTLRDEVKTKAGKLTDAEKLKRIFEKFEGVEEFIKNSEAQVKDVIQRKREVLTFPKPPKTSSLKRTSGILDWAKGAYEKLNVWLDGLLMAEQSLDDTIAEVEAI